MSDSLKKKILEKIEKEEMKAFCASDFLELGDYDGIRKAFERLTKEDKIRNVFPGVYYKTVYSEFFKMYGAPPIEECANALARKFNWNIAPGGNYCLNLLGLSTQVPAKYIFISDGPYRTYTIGKLTIEFRHSNKKEISNYSYITNVVIQALKMLGKENVDEKICERIAKKLPEGSKKILLKEARTTNLWIYEFIKVICEKGE